MALKLDDRVKETSTTTGSGTLDLSGAVSGFQTFVAGIGTTNTTYYAIVNRDAAEWEVGLGTVTDASTDTLSRSAISSSNSDSEVDFSAGTKDVFCTLPASKVASLDTNNNLTIGSGSAGVDYTLTFDGADADGVLTWMEDEDYFKFSDDVLILDNEKLILGTDENITITYDETTNDALEIAANVEGAALPIILKADQGDDAGDEWKLNVADGGVITLGNDINSAGTYVTHLTITPNSTVASSTAAFAGGVTIAGDLTISGDDLTMGTNTSGAALIGDGTNFNPVVISGDISIATNGAASIATNSVDGTHIALGSDAQGDIMYYDGTNWARLGYGTSGYFLKTQGTGANPAWAATTGTITAFTNGADNRIATGTSSTALNAEANLTFTGSALTCIGTITVGVDDTGHDVKFFGATASKYMEWDESADTLNVAGTVAIPAGGAITNAGTMAPDITSTGKAMVLGF